MPAQILADSWTTLLGYLRPNALEGVWLVVEHDDGHTAEGYAHLDHDGSLILTDDNGESHIFDRDDIDTVAI